MKKILLVGQQGCGKTTKLMSGLKHVYEAAGMSVELVDNYILIPEASCDCDVLITETNSPLFAKERHDEFDAVIHLTGKL